MLRAESAPVELLNNRVTDAIAKYRKILLVLVSLLYIFTFNGRWRIGLDSAVYRSLAISVASGNGYVYGNGAQKQVYPGFPYVLAGIEWMLGPADRTSGLAEQSRLIGPSAATTASDLFVLATALLTLIVVYRLIHLHYPTWVATTITCGVGTNAIFLQHAHELLTDMPFLLGVTTSLYAWELLKRAEDRRAIIRAACLLAAALGLAAVMRATFWVLALSLAAVCFFGLFTQRRRFHLICLLSLMAVWIFLILADSHFKGFHPMTAGYEREMVELVPRTWDYFLKQLGSILGDQLPGAMFGEHLAPFSIEGSIVLLGSVLMLFRRHTLWVLMVFLIVGVTIRLSAQPRYYMMVLPTLMLGWLVLFCWIARKLPRLPGEIVLVIGLSLVTLNNLSASVHLFREQRLSPYLMKYKNGEYVELIEMCEQIRQHVKADQNLMAPSGPIVSLLTGIHVYTQRELFPRGMDANSPKVVANIGLDFLVIPSSLYRSKEPVLERLMFKGVIRALDVVAQTASGATRLTQVQVVVPPGDWRLIERRPPRALTTAPARIATPGKVPRARPPKAVILARQRAATTHPATQMRP